MCVHLLTTSAMSSSSTSSLSMSPKTWVILTGGILGIVAMRMVIGQFLAIIERYPALVDGAFIIIAWVGIKLVLEYLHSAGYVHFEIPKPLSLGLIVVIFVAAFLYARAQEQRSGKHGGSDEAARELLVDDDPR